MRMRFAAFVVAAASFAWLAAPSAPASAAPGLVAKPEAGTAVVQEAGYYKRRWRYRDGAYVRAPFAEVDTRGDTWVAAPFARVYSGRRGTWVRAPFVNLWVPRYND
ncbi:MAG: hypothetical protein AB7V40_00725 [Methyloceanibacter sp.]